jgi:hypothetical protein
MSQKFVFFLKILLSFSGRGNLNPHLVPHPHPHFPCPPHAAPFLTTHIIIVIVIVILNQMKDQDQGF